MKPGHLPGLRLHIRGLFLPWMGKRMVDDILLHCRNDVGFASLKNVQTFEKTNSMESFFFAETLKYAYLLFAPESKMDFKKTVLTTEAHPFRRPQ